jgi:biopolymer transport protein ExbD
MAMGQVPGEGDGNDDDGLFAEINITPLTDIFLVLLIIFMVTSSVMTDQNARSGIKVTLPKGSAQDVTVKTKVLRVAVDPTGKVVLDGTEVEGPELLKAFGRAVQENPETVVVVQADTAVPHGRVVAVMELARSVGLQRIAIATQGGK